MELRNLKLLNSKKCPCGYEFTIKDITKIEVNTDYRFYGGRIQYYSIAKCPECKQEVVLLLEAYDNSYRIVDIGIDTIVDEQDEEVVEEVTEQVEEKNVCAKCNREFKSKAALTNHAKKCLKEG